LANNLRNEYEVIDWFIGFRWGIVSCGLGGNVVMIALARAKLTLFP